MADIELVIKIPEERYKNIVKQVDKRDYPDMSTGKAIANGTPLPKGHGRLIDADDLLDNTCLDEIPTIIEADKVEREEGEV